MPHTLDRCNAALEALYPLPDRLPPRVLEAGGGSYSHFVLPAGWRLCALDISHGQLVRNASTPWRVQGDVHALPLAVDSMGMVVCFNVIEHLEDPGRALQEMAACLASGGLLILGCPERSSLKGWVTRLTPLWFHRWYYRRVVGKRDRGEGHFDAFATPFKPVVSADALRHCLEASGCEILLLQCYDGAMEYGIVGNGGLRRYFSAAYYAVCALLRVCSLNRWRPEKSDILLLARKR